jgi:NAD(P)-dependent dehydrogenase (short-subunit alcohol dehydrogenase family)
MTTNGQAVLVTGATDGLGREVALDLARQGWTVLVHGRDAARGAALQGELQALGATSRFYRADFSALSEVAAMADDILAHEERLDVLLNNAGVMITEREESRDGYELAFQVNYLAPYLLTRRVLPLLERSAPARIVNVASAGQAPIDFADLMLRKDWERGRSYRQSKLAQIMMSFDMAPALAPRGVDINALHPGTFMPTKMVVGRFAPQTSLAEGAGNVVRLVADPALKGVGGRYFDGAAEARAADQAYDEAALMRLRAISDELCGDALAVS